MDKELKRTSTTRDSLKYLNLIESNARTYVRDFPVIIEKGQNSIVTDIDGNNYIDCLAGAGTLALGHNHEVVINAIEKFLRSGHIMHGLDLATPVKIEFTKVLLQCFPEEFGKNAKIQFCGPTGADAVEAVVKLFKTYTKRSTIVAFHGAYHGMSNGALSLTGNLKAKNEVKALMPEVHFLPYPYTYRCPFGIENKNSIDLSLNYIKSVLTDPCSGITKPAAIIVEAVQGEGGCIPADTRWLYELRKITEELEIPLILDEIQTGFGRTGTMFAFEQSGIIPDAVVISKAVGGGLPLSAVVYNKKYDLWSPGAHAGTFRGNQLAMATGIATMEYLIDHNILKLCKEKGDYIINKLNELKDGCHIIGDVRGRGLMIGVEIIDPMKPKDFMGRCPNSSELTNKIKSECLNQGLIIESGGRYNSVLRLLPPLIISMREIDDIISILKSVLIQVNKECLSVYI
jgi:diaminobutyrate-2-oxoglutarate transaminase